jgi:uncharacterized protein (TIGR02246 family)
VSEPEIANQLVASFAAAWNRHDMDALAGLFHEDAAFVNVLGSYMRGREQIRAQHSAVHAGPYKDSVLRVEVLDTREPAPTVLLAHVRTELDGDARAPDETRYSLVTFVIEQRAELWRFTAAHNTLANAPG